MHNEDIAIVGISIYCPAGDTTEQVWDGLAHGGDYITEVPHHIIEPEFFTGEPNAIDRFYCKRGGFCKRFKLDPLRYGILPIIADGIDPEQLVSLAGSEFALHDAGVFDKDISLDRCGIIIGKGNFSGLVALRSIEVVRQSHQVANILKSALPELTESDLEEIRVGYQSHQGRYQPDMAIGTMPNLVASLVANRFDMHGPAYTVDAACASGIVAINHGMALLRRDECDIIVAGAMHPNHSPIFWGGFDLLGAMSKKEVCAPFSKHADGLIVGQGGGFLVLKMLKKAIDDGDRIYAVIKETAIASDGGGSHVLVTNTAGQIRVLEQAWKRAGMDPDILGYVEAHGTATQVGDRTEIETLKQFFGDNTHPQAYVGSVKSNFGHTIAAAGMVGVIKTALSLYYRKIPPTLHCEEPLDAMFESRFLPPQELIDWDPEKYPLIAGVNSFGFGGINSHAILSAYEPAKNAPPQPRPKQYKGESYMISAESLEMLITKMETGDFTNTGGNYRLVVLDPTDERMDQALEIVKKDKPWKGRLGIWFTNNPLLTAGGKVVFLFPGFGAEFFTETDSLSDYMEFPRVNDQIEEERKSHQEIDFDKEGVRAIYWVYYCEALAIRALEALGVQADIFTGHSLGEWEAARFAGIADGDQDLCRKTILEIINAEKYTTYPFIAVSGVDEETAEGWCREIPDLYLTCYNCPSQVLLTGTEESVAILRKKLEEDRIFNAVMPLGLGGHTPLAKEWLIPMMDYLNTLKIEKGQVEVWSATTLDKIPTEKEAYLQQAQFNMTHPVYFQDLIEKLYHEQNARVFIQIGVGNLPGFVDEILKDKDLSTISTNNSVRDAFDQMRHVMAMLFVEGHEAVYDFMGVSPFHQTDRSVISLPVAAPIMRDFPELREVIRKRYGDAGPGGSFGTASETDHPLVRMAKENLRDVVETQGQFMELFERMNPGIPEMPKSRGLLQGGKAAAAEAPPSVDPVGQEKPFVENMEILLDDHPYLMDHAIIKQPKDWPYQDDLNPVVPLTMTIELLAEMAKRHAPGKKLLKVSSIMAYRFMSVEKPFVAPVKGKWKSTDTLTLDMAGYVKGDFTFGDEYPEPPAEYVGDIDIGEMLNGWVWRPPEYFYTKYAFHGPMYHSATDQLDGCTKGLRARARKSPGKGSLLDIMGQQLGLYLCLTQTENTIAFPVRLKELNFFADILDQEGEFIHTLVMKKMTATVIAGDAVFKRDGKIWCVGRDFVLQRFISTRLENKATHTGVIFNPEYNLISEEIAPGVFHYTNNSEENVLRLLEKRYFNYVDREAMSKLESVDSQREYLFGRIAIKDAVRKYVAAADEDYLFPVEIFCGHDEKGKPFVYGEREVEERIKPVHVSLSHKDQEAVAIAADVPVGIDLERIEEKAQSFVDVALTKKEQTLIREAKRDEDVIRFWVAKEACAKKNGNGLKYQPKQYEVTAVSGDVLTVGTQQVRTLRVGEEYIAGWTI